jgi:hypothetical protein
LIPVKVTAVEMNAQPIGVGVVVCGSPVGVCAILEAFVEGSVVYDSQPCLGVPSTII